MKVPNNYVRSKCCHAYQDPSNTVCIRCGEPFQSEEAVEQPRALDEGDSLSESELSNDELDPEYEVWANL